MIITYYKHEMLGHHILDKTICWCWSEDVLVRCLEQQSGTVGHPKKTQLHVQMWKIHREACSENDCHGLIFTCWFRGWYRNPIPWSWSGLCVFGLQHQWPTSVGASCPKHIDFSSLTSGKKMWTVLDTWLTWLILTRLQGGRWVWSPFSFAVGKWSPSKGIMGQDWKPSLKQRWTSGLIILSSELCCLDTSPVSALSSILPRSIPFWSGELFAFGVVCVSHFQEHWRIVYEP